MKKTMILFSAIVVMASCGNNAENKPTEAKPDTTTQAPAPPPPTETAPAGNSEAEKGMTLVAKSDCLTCHKVNEKLVGPAYQDVAAKYPSNAAVIDSLSNKIIHGGSGNWGQVPMAAHPAISKADAELMVKYVLSLKK